MIKDILVFSLSSNTHLTDKVCDLLGINRSEAEVLHFADGECLATSKVDVRGKKIYIIQSTCGPVNDRIMELKELIVKKLHLLFLIMVMLDKTALLTVMSQ